MEEEYVCTKCGKPAVFTWNRYGRKWGSCSEHGYELMSFPDARDFENYYIFDNGYTIYKEGGGIER